MLTRFFQFLISLPPLFPLQLRKLQNTPRKNAMFQFKFSSVSMEPLP